MFQVLIAALDLLYVRTMVLSQYASYCSLGLLAEIVCLEDKHWVNYYHCIHTEGTRLWQCQPCM